jgi:hypothetical protein
MVRRLRTKNVEGICRGVHPCSPVRTNVLRRKTRSPSQHVTYSDLDLNVGRPKYEVASITLFWILYGHYYHDSIHTAYVVL